MEALQPKESVAKTAARPVRLMDTEKATSLVVKAESNNYRAPVTRLQGKPPFRESMSDDKGSIYVKAWQPLADVVFDAPEFQALFESVKDQARQSKTLEELIAKHDLAEQAKFGEQYKAKATSIYKDKAVQAELDRLLKPILDAIDGNGSLKDSLLPPALIDWLLKLDDQVKNFWGQKARQNLIAKRAAQVPEGERRALQLKLASQLTPEKISEVEAELARDDLPQDRRASLLNALKVQLDERELKKLKLKLEVQLSSSELAQVDDQLKNFDAELAETRKSAFSAFIGVRGICAFFKSKLFNPDDRVKTLLDTHLAKLTLDLPILQRLIDCNGQERDDIAISAQRQMLKLQQDLKRNRGSQGKPGRSIAGTSKEVMTAKRQLLVKRFVDEFGLNRPVIADQQEELAGLLTRLNKGIKQEAKERAALKTINLVQYSLKLVNAYIQQLDDDAEDVPAEILKLGHQLRLKEKSLLAKEAERNARPREKEDRADQ